MKEMLFITVAVLVPPTLTFLGVVGERPQSRFEQGWHLPAGANQPPPAAGERNGASSPRPCWPVTAQRQPTSSYRAETSRRPATLVPSCARVYS